MESSSESNSFIMNSSSETNTSITESSYETNTSIMESSYEPNTSIMESSYEPPSECQEYIFVYFFPETENLNWPLTKYFHIEHIERKNTLIDNDEDYKTVRNNGKWFRFVMKKDFIKHLTNEEIIIILKKIISNNYDVTNICPVYICYDKTTINYCWSNNEFKNKFEDNLFFDTFYK